MEKLIKAAQGGSKNAFVSLIEAHKVSMTRAAKAILSDDHDVADAIGETVLTALQKLGDLKKPKHFSTWLMRILINNCYQILRRRKRMVPVEIMPEEGYVVDNDTRLDVAETLSRLSENDRLVLTLFYLDEISVRDIASMLETNENTIKTRLRRGRSRFEKAYTMKESKEESYAVP